MSKLLKISMLDFRTVKSYLLAKTILLFVAVMSLVGFTANPTMTLFLGMFFSYFYISYPFAIGEKINMDALYRTLGISKKELVSGRYIFAFIMLLGGTVFSLLASVAVSFISTQKINIEENIGVTFVFLGILMLLASTQMPFYFKYPYSKTRVITLIPLFITSMGIPLIARFWDKPWMFEVREFFGGVHLSRGAIIVIAVLVLACCVACSYALSVRFYQKREF
ncbi:MAG: ABC-2 transporter permease [Oscillospiraceae bacterium]|jgi:hypothetical protein|nr:ABC-2 transporter permease [Oscillospiraceae bacterium]